MLAAGSASATSLTWNQAVVVLAIIAGVVLLAGVIVITGRRVVKGADPHQSMVRSWLAIALVAALVLFCAVSFAVNNSSLQSTLFGALTTGTGAAIAFYFSSKNADQARQDVLNAASGTDSVPNLKGLTKAEATSQLGTTAFSLEIDPASSTVTPDDVVTSQTPPASSVARKGASIVVTLGAPTA